MAASLHEPQDAGDVEPVDHPAPQESASRGVPVAREAGRST